jgi:hypothetical protein
MLAVLILIINGILYRLDGWGKGDAFLPFWPFNKYEWLKTGGINYTRYAIGPVIALFTHQWWFLATYTVAASIPFGEKHWWMKYGLWSWFLIGLIWGAASLNWEFALWIGLVNVIAKKLNLTHSWWEFGIMGVLGTTNILI